jgi:hypothetical protein
MTYRRLRYSKAVAFRRVASGVECFKPGSPAPFLDEVYGPREVRTQLARSRPPQASLPKTVRNGVGATI